MKIDKILRISDWWNFIIPPVLGFSFLSAFLFRVSFPDSLQVSLLLLILSMSTASFGFFINEITDIEEDRRKGKENYTASLTPGLKVLVVMSLLMVQATCLYLLRPGHLIYLHIAELLLFMLYSLPPFRLKRILPIAPLLDALYSGTLYFLLAFLLYPVNMGMEAEIAVIVVIATLGILRGLKNILWHFENDREADLRAEHRTVAHRNGHGSIPLKKIIMVLGLTEGVAFFALFYFSGVPWYWWPASILFYGFLQWKKLNKTGTAVTIDNLLLEFFLPVMAIVSCSYEINPAYLLYLAALIFIFPDIRSWFTALRRKLGTP